MLNLAEYRKKPDQLADYLPWAALIAPSVVLNKDGSFQRTVSYRGPDLESATEAELVGVSARINNILRRFGSRLLKSKKWLTFSDFLMDYMSETLGGGWGNAEIAKLEKERHPLIKWYQSMCLHQEKYIIKKGTLTSMPINGAMRGYLGLAYDLYLTEHNIELPEKLIARLKNEGQFEGALYEAYVIGRFAKAGFSIEFEDEDDPTTTHSEFVATHRVTGGKFAVEAKSVSMNSSRAGKTDKPVAIRQKLHDALKKKADYPRIVFVEVSRAEGEAEAREAPWMKEMLDDITEAEKNLTIKEDPAPSAYLFITNRPFVHDIEGLKSDGFYSATGFKIDDFPFERAAKSVLLMHRLRQKHIEPYALLKAFQEHWDISQQHHILALALTDRTGSIGSIATRADIHNLA